MESLMFVRNRIFHIVIRRKIVEGNFEHHCHRNERETQNEILSNPNVMKNKNDA